MASIFGAACGLLAFAAMILRGLMAGNAVDVILIRALGGLFGFLIVGTIAGYLAARVLEDRSAIPGDDAADTQHADHPSGTAGA